MTGRFAKPVVTPYTGTGAISESYAPSMDFWLHSVTIHLSAIPTTSESVTITLNALDGSAYDTLLVSYNFMDNSTKDLFWQPEDGPMLCEAGDCIDIAFTNTDVATYGVRVVTSFT